MNTKNKKNQKTNENNKTYKILSFDRAIELIKSSKKRNFSENIDVAIQLNVIPSKKNISIKGHSILPHSLEKKVKIAAFLTTETEINDANNSNIDIIIQEKDITDFTKKNIKFDLIITTPTSIIKMGKLNKTLGSKNLMPDIKYGTITTNIKDTINKIQNNYIKFKTDKNDIIHTSIGKINSDTEKLKENIENLIMDIKKYKPQNCKSVNIKNIHISSTMGNSFNINLNSLNI